MKDGCRRKRSGWWLAVVGCMGAIAWVIPTEAQLVPDATLGTESSVVSPLGQAADRVDGGATRGINLFHSFEQFNVGAGRGVYFANPAGVENILSRVTGNSRSEIMGRLGVLGNANLFLLNPNGIVFGANASLDVAGSFTATTANAIALGNQGFFSATQPENSSLLAIAPGALFFDQQLRQPRTIQNSGNLTAGRDLTLAADNLELQGQLRSGGNLTLQAQDTLRIRDSVTAPFIAAAGGSLLVQGDRSVDIFALSHPDSGLFSGGDMVLRSANTIGGDARFRSGGNLQLERLNGTPGELFSPYDPVFEVFGNFTSAGFTGIGSIQILAGGSVTINGDITVTTPGTPFNNSTVDLSDGTSVELRGGIDEPTLDIRAGTTTFFGALSLGSPPIPPTRADITINGTISVGTDILPGKTLLTNKFSANALPGSITVNGSVLAYGPVYIDSRGGLITGPATQLGYGGVDTSAPSGTAGEIRLIADGAIDTTSGDLNSFIGTVDTTTGDRTLTNGTAGDITLISRNGSVATAGISSLVLGGKGGNVTLTATGNIVPGNITSSIFDASIAGDKAGDIIFKSNSDVVLVGSKILSTTSGNGDAGNIGVQARSLSLSPSPAILTDPNNAVSVISSETAGTGNAGTISLQTQFLSITGGSEILARTTGAGNAGNILVEPLNPSLPSTITISGYAPFTGLDGNGDPNGGFSSGLFVSTETQPNFPAGDAGIIVIDGITTLNVRDGGVLSARTRSEGSAGQDRFGNGQPLSIFANVQDLNLTGGGQILAPTYSTGAAGTIFINATGTVTIQGSDSNYTARRQALAAVLQPQDPTSDAALAQALVTIDPVSQNSGIIASDLPLLTLDPDGLGAPGTIVVQAGAVRLSDIGVIESRNYGNQPGGGVGIRTQNLSLSGGAEILSETFGSGQAGSIIVEPIDATAPSVVSISGVAPYPLLRDGSSPGGFSSGLFATTEKDATGQGGTISVTTGALRIEQGGVISTRSRGNGDVVAKPDDVAIAIDVGTLDIQSGGQILATAFSSGRAGSIAVEASGDVRISDADTTYQSRFDAVSAQFGEDQAKFTIDPNGPSSGLQAQSLSADSRGSGNITVRTNGSILLQGGATTSEQVELSTSTAGLGNAGNVSLMAGSVTLDNAIVFSQVDSTSSGNGGTISITANAVSLQNGSQLQTQTNSSSLNLDESRSQAGNVVIQTNGGTVSLDGRSTTIFSSVEPDSVGDGGNIQIFTGSLAMSGGAQLQTLLRGPYRSTDRFGATGNAGVVYVQATDSISLNGSTTGILTTIQPGADGDTGNNFFAGNIFNQFLGLPGKPIGSIFLATGTLSLSDGAVLDSSTYGLGNAGAVVIFADREVTLRNGSGILSTAAATAGDNAIAGGIVMDVGSLLLESNSAITTQTGNSNGSAGLTFISSRDTVRLDRRSTIQATTLSGNGGNIEVDATRYLLLRRDSNIRTDAGLGAGTGDGGNIFIRTPFIIAAPSRDNNITANAVNDRGGNVDVTAPDGGRTGLFGIRFRPKDNPRTNDITASSERGVAGNVFINALDTTLVENSLTELAQNLIDPNALLANSCIVRNRDKNRGPNGTFLVTGSGGLPVRPGDPPPSPFPTGEVRSLPESGNREQGTEDRRSWQPGDPIVEPQGIYRLASGKLVMSRECEP